MKLLCATTNPGKLAELRALVAHLAIEVIAPHQLPTPLPVIDEDGATFEANARKKAEGGLAASGLVTLADDSGLEVAALGGAPGVHSARYAGCASEPAGADPSPRPRGRLRVDAANNDKLLAALLGVADRAARFRCALALAVPGRPTLVVCGELAGEIARAPRGHQGFGYDPLFVVRDEHRTLAELSDDEKNRCSHRARALAGMAPHIVALAAAPGLG